MKNTDLDNALCTSLQVDDNISGLSGSAPEQLNTLNELSQALQHHSNLNTTLTHLIHTQANTMEFHNKFDLYYAKMHIDNLVSLYHSKKKELDDKLNLYYSKLQIDDTLSLYYTKYKSVIDLVYTTIKERQIQTLICIT